MAFGLQNRFRIDGEIAENHAILVNLTASITIRINLRLKTLGYYIRIETISHCDWHCLYCLFIARVGSRLCQCHRLHSQ